MTLRDSDFTRAAIALAIFLPTSLAHGETISSKDLEAAKDSAEKVKSAYEFGKDPSTEKVLDAAITAMTIGYPPAGAALGAMKGMMSMLGFFDKPDMVGEALRQLAARLQVLESRLAYLESQVLQIRNQQFKDQNLARVRELQQRHRELQGHVFELKERPTDPAIRRSLANKGKILADSFLLEYDADLWQWSDLDEATQQMFPPDFKPLPALEYYVGSLVFWMAAIETAAAGDRQFVITTYGTDLARHARFLSVRDGWDDLSGAAQTLPEQVAVRVLCGLSPMSKYPDPNTGMCTAAMLCNDAMARRSNMVAGTSEFAGTAGALCTISADQPRPPEEDLIEEFYGTGFMATLSTRLGVLAETGTVREPYYGSFDMRFYTNQFLYGVKQDGTLTWHQHVITEDRNPPGVGTAAVSRFKNVDVLAVQPRADAGQAPASAIASAGIRNKLLVSPSVAVQPRLLERAAPVKPQAAPARITHEVSAGAATGVGWGAFRDIYPAGNSGMYALTAEGILSWYRHDGWQDGSPKWKGPVTLANNWHLFPRIVPGGDGVLYAVDQNGSLLWYRHDDYQDARSPSSWQGPSLVGTGWGHFVEIFSSGEGVIYAVQPDGTLLWYRHTGYLAGAPTWEGPSAVGSGWQIFKRVFSPGEGHIYALRPTGELLYYHHVAYNTGAPTWDEPVELSPDWGGYRLVFARMWGTQQGPVVR